VQVGCRPPGGNVGDSQLGGEFGKTSVSRRQVPSTARSRPATYHDTSVFKAQKTCVDTDG